MEKKKAPPPVSDINVTPMVDVMLVLLIIFMVITPMLTKGQTVDMVRTKNPIAMQAADKEDAILIAVTRNGSVFLSPGNIKCTADQLPEKVRDLLTNRMDKMVLHQGRCASTVLGGRRCRGQFARGRRGSDRIDHRSDSGHSKKPGAPASPTARIVRMLGGRTRI